MARLRKAIAALCACAVVGLAGALMLGATAQGQTATEGPYWSCSASPAYVDLNLGNPPFNPLHLDPFSANGASKFCATDATGLPNIVLGGGPSDPGSISVQGPFGRTAITPETAKTQSQSIKSDAGVAGNQITPGVEIKTADGSFDLQVIAAGSNATAACSAPDGHVVPTGQSTVATVMINGQKIPTDIDHDILMPLEQQVLSNFNPLLEIHFNQQTKDNGTTADHFLIQRAVDVQLKNPNSGDVILHAVVAESKVNWHGDVCATPTGPTANCPAGTEPDPSNPLVCIKSVGKCAQGTVEDQNGNCVAAETQCPAGSTKNDQGVCVQTNNSCPQGSTPNSQGQCVVGPAGPNGECPSGSVNNGQGQCVLTQRTCGPGTVENQQGQCVVASSQCPNGSTKNAQGQCVANGPQEVPLQQVLGARAGSPCKNKAFGSQVAIVGTNGPDKITGTNRSDRIFTFAGNDRVSGGRGNDCLEAGKGFDRFDGSNGADYELADDGNDIANGGPGPDRLYGERGNDKLVGASGNDRLYGGPGRDKLQGGLGNDALYGGPGNDYIDSGGGRDRIYAGAGNDSINVAIAGAPAKLIDCGPGNDKVRVNTDEVSRVRKNCEHVFVTRQLRR